MRGFARPFVVAALALLEAAFVLTLLAACSEGVTMTKPSGPIPNQCGSYSDSNLNSDSYRHLYGYSVPKGIPTVKVRVR
jgi:hypothetical protein